jgi:thiol-disulfide isomerase/thioredoxin
MDQSTATTTGERGELVLPVEGEFPELSGIGPWINSPPLTRKQLKGKVVLIDFWTYSCINCVRSIPYVRAWHDRYAKDGLVVIGVHAPEFAFERSLDNVKAAVADLGIRYPVALDNDFKLWRAFKNNYWPAQYFIDAQGRVRYHHFGEGKYAESERVIRQLLTEAGHPPSVELAGAAATQASEMGAAFDKLKSRETYIGYNRADRFESPGGLLKDRAKAYSVPSRLELNQWALEGRWTAGPQAARLDAPGGRIVYRFHARDVHLVLAPREDGRPVRFRVTVDGRAPGADAGGDINANGSGAVTEERLYQLIRQKDAVADRTFAIEFLDPGVRAFAFTFG